MNKYSYFTPEELADIIINTLPEQNIQSVIDICCGSWNLLSAANKHYPDAQFVGVDIDPSSGTRSLNNSIFINDDGRLFAISEYTNGITYDLVISNPPFGDVTNDNRIMHQNRFLLPLIGANLFYKRYEIEMLMANFLLVSPNGYLVIIMPSSFAFGDKYISLRAAICKMFGVLSVFELPEETFEKGKVGTCAVVLQRNNFNHALTRYYYAKLSAGKWELDNVGVINKNDVENGYWNCLRPNNTFNYTMYRGNISSSEFSESGIPVFHCRKKGSEKWAPSIKYVPSEYAGKGKTAKIGDIIINRIGRDAGSWCINSIGEFFLSDCLICISEPSPLLINRLLAASDSNGKLYWKKHNLATDYITYNDIKTLLSVEV